MFSRVSLHTTTDGINGLSLGLRRARRRQKTLFSGTVVIITVPFQIKLDCSRIIVSLRAQGINKGSRKRKRQTAVAS